MGVPLLRLLVALLVTGLTLTGCRSEVSEAPRPGQPAATPVRVVAISVDGLNPDVLEMLGPAGAPSFHRLLAEGTGTLNARTTVEQTITLPNHTSMFTGRRVDPADGGHGVVAAKDDGREITELAGEPVSSVFDVVRQAGLGTRLYTVKPKFDLYRRAWKMDAFVLAESDSGAVDSLVADLADQRDGLLFLHLAALDHAGHDAGFLGAAYLSAARSTDALLAEVLEAVDADQEASTVVLLTADHGGAGEDHQDAADPANFRIPFILRGPGVPAGVDLYSLSDELEDPGEGRPAYDGPQPVRNAMVADLTTALLGLPEVPGSQARVPKDLVTVLLR